MSSLAPSFAPTTPSKSRKGTYEKASIKLARKKKLEGKIATKESKPSTTGKGDDRYPSERSKITSWADNYMAMGEKTPSEFIASQGGKASGFLENSEEPTLFEYPSTPRKNNNPQQITIVHQRLMVLYSSPHSKNTPQELVRKAGLAPNSELLTIEEVEEEGNSIRPQLFRSLAKTFKIAELNLEYTAADVPECPVVSYTAKNYKSIPHDWESSGHIHVLGVPVALKYWPEVYQNKGTEEFARRRNKWKLWKVRSLLTLVLVSRFSEFSKLSADPSFPGYRGGLRPCRAQLGDLRRAACSSYSSRWQLSAADQL
jgi:hypothetical protein